MTNDQTLYADGRRDASAALQALLDKRGLVEIPAGTYLIEKPLIIHDDTHLKLAPTATLHLADGANCALLDNDGLYRRAQNRNIIIEGGIWDGNNSAQTRESIEDENLPCDYDKYVSNTLTVMMIRLVHVEGLTVRNVTFKDPTSFAIHIADVRHFTVENVRLDYDLSKPNMDGVHIQGPARFGRISGIWGNANDDHVALCANGTARSEVTRGDIEDVDIDGVYCDNGYTGVRLLSSGDAIRNVRISNIHGEFRYYAVSFTHHYPLREDRPVLLENVHVSDVYASKSRAECPWANHRNAVREGAIIWFEGGIHCKNVTVERVFRCERNPDTEAPTVRLSEGVHATNLQLRDICESFVGKPLLSIENHGICD